MPIIWYEFCTKYALPDADDSRGWIRDTLATAAFHLGDTDLENRIHDDESYGQALCDVVSLALLYFVHAKSLYQY